MSNICIKCVHSYVCEKFNANRDLQREKCEYKVSHFADIDNVVEVDKVAQKIATALAKADVDCIKICGNFGGGCYWKCEEKVEHIKEWIVGVIENA
jgi:hypothetical protein